MTKKKFKLSQLNIFLLVAGTIDIIFIIANMISGGALLSTEALGANFIFGDYYSNLGFSSYGADLYHMPEYVCFPPLAYCFYYLCYLMAPSPSSSILAEINWLDFTNGANTPLIFLMMNLISIVIFGWVCARYFSESGTASSKYTILLPIVILLSYPCMLTSLQRGNSAFLVAVLLCIAWLFADSSYPETSAGKLEAFGSAQEASAGKLKTSDSSQEASAGKLETSGSEVQLHGAKHINIDVKKEAALLLIAVATAFKVYPAIMGLYFIKKKDFKAVIRLVIYGLILFFVPFIWFGGVDGIKAFFNTLLHMSDWNLDEHFGTVRGMVYYLLRRHSSLTAAAAETVGYVFEQIFLVASLILFFISKKKWQSVLMISAILASYIGGNAHYTFVYYLPALLMFLREVPSVETTQEILSSDDSPKYNSKCFSGVSTVLCTLCFAFIFSCPFFFPNGCYFGVSLASYLLWIIGAVNIISNIKTK